MIEDEAKAKWCPFVRLEGNIAGSFNRGTSENPALVNSAYSSACVASACMMWRKSGRSWFKDARTGKLEDRDLTGHGIWLHDGFCGLAGVTPK